MLYQAHVEHFIAGSGATESDCWADHPSAVVGETSAFSLTPLGEVFGESLIKSLLLPEGTEEFERACGLLRVGRLTPRYTPSGRHFTWGRHLVKCFKQPATDQELILLAADELG
jgi:hypothetical protein